jgi:hypothetical protein
LTKLAKLWQSDGLVGADTDATAIADLFITLMPGMLIMRPLYKPATAARLADGIVAFAGAGSPARPRVGRQMIASPSNRVRSRP